VPKPSFLESTERRGQPVCRTTRGPLPGRFRDTAGAQRRDAKLKLILNLLNTRKMVFGVDDIMATPCLFLRETLRSLYRTAQS
jgi:hypothetical protein